MSHTLKSENHQLSLSEYGYWIWCSAVCFYFKLPFLCCTVLVIFKEIRPTFTLKNRVPSCFACFAWQSIMHFSGVYLAQIIWVYGVMGCALVCLCSWLPNYAVYGVHMGPHLSNFNYYRTSVYIFLYWLLSQSLHLLYSIHLPHCHFIRSTSHL